MVVWGSDVLPHLRFQPFWHLLRVPYPSRTLSWLDMPARPTHSLKRSVRLGRTRSGHHPPPPMSCTNSLSETGRAFSSIKLQWNLVWSLVSIRPVSGLLLPHTVVTGFMPYPSFQAVSVSMMNPFRPRGSGSAAGVQRLRSTCVRLWHSG